MSVSRTRGNKSSVSVSFYYHVRRNFLLPSINDDESAAASCSIKDGTMAPKQGRQKVPSLRDPRHEPVRKRRNPLLASINDVESAAASCSIKNGTMAPKQGRQKVPSLRDPIHEPVKTPLRLDAKAAMARAAPNSDVREALLVEKAPVEVLTEEDLEEGLLRKPGDVDKEQLPCDDTRPTGLVQAQHLTEDDTEEALEKPGVVDKEEQPRDDTHPTGDEALDPRVVEREQKGLDADAQTTGHEIPKQDTGPTEGSWSRLLKVKGNKSGSSASSSSRWSVSENARRLCRKLSEPDPPPQSCEAYTNAESTPTMTLESGATLLDDACSYFVAKLGSDIWKGFEEKAEFFPAVVDLGSACSGSAIWDTCVGKIMRVLSSLMTSDVCSRIRFVCEKDKSNPTFLMNLTCNALLPEHK
ncbi:hypothetical protein N9L68_05585 [bacterium]|nr:hypothetical protein [bacterium]